MYVNVNVGLFTSMKHKKRSKECIHKLYQNLIGLYKTNKYYILRD